jgi:hypothetical protein
MNKTMKTRTTMTSLVLGGLLLAGGSARAEQHQAYAITQGDGWFGAGFSTENHTWAKRSGQTSPSGGRGSGNAWINFFGATFDVVNAPISYEANGNATDPKLAGTAQAYLFGQKVAETSTASARSIDVFTGFLTIASPRVDYRFTIGPVPMRVSAWAEGRAAASNFASTGGSSTSSTSGNRVYAYAALPLYAEAAVDAVVASFGVTAQVNLVRATQNTSAYEGYTFTKTSDTSCDTKTLQERSLSESNLSMLSGDLSAFVRVSYVVDSKTWRANLFGWGGFTNSWPKTSTSVANAVGNETCPLLPAPPPPPVES